MRHFNISQIFSIKKSILENEKDIAILEYDIEELQKTILHQTTHNYTKTVEKSILLLNIHKTHLEYLKAQKESAIFDLNLLTEDPGKN